MSESHFSYGWTPKGHIIISFVFLLLITSIDLAAMSEHDVGLRIMLPLLNIFMLLMFLVFITVYSGVFVNSNEIGSTIFGCKWKSIKWVDVTTVTVTHPPDFQGGRDSLYWIGAPSSKQTYASPKGRVMFTKRIRNLDALIAEINRYSMHRNIEFREEIPDSAGLIGKSNYKKIESL